uniref:Uncharacterized protein n=1 Tax=Chromera velia CCMP2878 TaxID=1169474 RepID=A0A0G4F4F4_9ALVE|eukprot:Cvel_15050.t1-p1 / transcript=Cvel_15050.t1 / gene=Cvel_15050 / organism=Chromera_velia_CCMP2878 / gene_product=hypothetical protein / transcript_product=hypothetical protein / location=Cvel_scaffold1096:10251-10610(+) / protein_length=120 / sequence_SO=supercontig / SO=protein_coding / is_pseudo=false
MEEDQVRSLWKAHLQRNTSVMQRKRVGGDRLKSLCEEFLTSVIGGSAGGGDGNSQGGGLDLGQMVKSSLTTTWLSFGDRAHVEVSFIRGHVAGDMVRRFVMRVDIPRLDLLECTLTETAL